MEVDLDQIATYWRPSANDGMGGVTWSQGLEIPVAHCDKVEEVRTAEGKKFISKAIYYTNIVLQLGDYIALGTYEGAANPIDAREVMYLSGNSSFTTLNKVLV